MSVTITSSTFAGEHAGLYVGTMLKQAKSLEFINVLENIKHKRVINTVADASLLQNAACDFSDAGTFTTNEVVLEPKRLMINTQLCKSTAIDDWQALQMKAGQHNNNFSDDFMAFIMSRIAGRVAHQIENNIWNGDGTAAGQFEGFIQDTSGTLESATGLLTDAAAGAYIAGTGTGYIITELTDLVDKIPSAVYGADDLYIYMNNKTYRIYIQAMSALGYNDAYHMGDNYRPSFNGVNIAVCPGMKDNEMVAAQSSNLHFGTDLISDLTEVKVLDMSELDGSDNLRIVVRLSAGTAATNASDCVHQS